MPASSSAVRERRARAHARDRDVDCILDVRNEERFGGQVVELVALTERRSPTPDAPFTRSRTGVVGPGCELRDVREPRHERGSFESRARTTTAELAFDVLSPTPDLAATRADASMNAAHRDVGGGGNTFEGPGIGLGPVVRRARIAISERADARHGSVRLDEAHRETANTETRRS